jgi:hypothetical protein
VLTHYDALDADLRAGLPWKRIWTNRPIGHGMSFVAYRELGRKTRGGVV